MKRQPNFRVDRVFPGVGRINLVSGATTKAEHKKRDAVLTKLYDTGRLELLRAIRRRQLTINEVFSAERFLAAVGTYGLVAYAVIRRTHELGVRIALGASGTRVRRLVLRQGAALALAGVAIGVAAALAAGTVIQSLLYEVGAADPATLTAASLVLFVVVLLAVDVPARRAGRLDPIEALRHE